MAAMGVGGEAVCGQWQFLLSRCTGPILPRCVWCSSAQQALDPSAQAVTWG